ncbi:hypothetical protein, partial [Candidatus Binatus sp.]|uniref:hypothetical protein n=1 Tax=Candidatus Binatus sp. TaxID=2811406 RepID=UPI002FD90E0D
TELEDSAAGSDLIVKLDHYRAPGAWRKPPSPMTASRIECRLYVADCALSGRGVLLPFVLNASHQSDQPMYR